MFHEVNIIMMKHPIYDGNGKVRVCDVQFQLVCLSWHQNDSNSSYFTHCHNFMLLYLLGWCGEEIGILCRYIIKNRVQWSLWRKFVVKQSWWHTSCCSLSAAWEDGRRSMAPFSAPPPAVQDTQRRWRLLPSWLLSYIAGWSWEKSFGENYSSIFSRDSDLTTTNISYIYILCTN